MSNKIYQFLYKVLHDNNHKTPAEIIWSATMQSMIIISLVSITIDTLPTLDPTTKYALQIVELVSIILFSVEYFLKIITSKKPTSYIFSWWGVIDLLAILPYYLATSVDLRTLRAFRLFRLLRVMRLVKADNALTKLVNALKIAAPELMLFLITSMIIIYLAAIGIYSFEHAVQPDKFQSIPDALWWSVITLTTIGYGDVYPITVGGKIFTTIVVLVGLGFIAMPSSIMTSALTQARLHHEQLEEERLEKKRQKAEEKAKMEEEKKKKNQSIFSRFWK